MEKFIICGGEALNGTVAISGMKNSALPILFGTIAAEGVFTIKNLPDISDVRDALAIIESIGARVRFVDTNTVIINTEGVTLKSPPLELVGKIRASYYLLGAMLGRFKKAQVGQPGGCDFGNGRPINQHKSGFELLGARVSYESNAAITLNAADGLKGNFIYFDIASGEQSLFTSGRILDEVSAYLKTIFCGAFYGDVKIVERQRDATVVEEQVVEPEEEAPLETRYFEIVDFKRLDGADTLRDLHGGLGESNATVRHLRQHYVHRRKALYSPR